MAAKQTPEKTILVDCFICSISNAKSFKLSGRKVKSGDFLQKLKILLNDDSVLSSLTQFVLKNEFIVIRRTSSSRRSIVFTFGALVYLAVNWQKIVRKVFVNVLLSVVFIYNFYAFPCKPLKI